MSEEAAVTPAQVLTDVYTDPVVWAIMIGSATLGVVLNSWAMAFGAVTAGSVVYLGVFADVV